MLHAYELIQLIDQPTHEFGHTLDILIVRKEDEPPENIRVEDKAVSDHFLLTFQSSIRANKKPKRYVSSRAMKSIVLGDFKYDIRTTLQSLDHVSADSLCRSLRNVLDEHAPLKTRHLNNRPCAPWITDEVKVKKREKRQAESQWRKTKLNVHKEMFKEKKCQLNKAIRSAKRLHYAEKLNNAKNCKQLYSVLDDLLHKPTTSPTPSGDDKELCHQFSVFFQNKISEIRRNLDQTRAPLTSDEQPFIGTELNKFSFLSPCEVSKMIKESPSKTCELDPIPTNLLKECLDDILPHLTEIINHSLQTGTVPDVFKSAIIKPLLKKPNLDENELKNYRPVSNLQFLSKILEKIVLQQLLDHISFNNLAEKFQSAYRPKHSTETALLNVVDDILLQIDERKVCLLIMLDLSAAFDTVDHSILIERLKKGFGVNGKALEWFRSYLSNRKQQVRVNQELSDDVDIHFGVPQGSVLGPILFTLYTQPLMKILRDWQLQYHAYADDTQIYVSCVLEDISNTSHQIEECLHDVKNWMVNNKLMLNDSKTEIIVFGHPNITKSIDTICCNINGAVIDSSKVVRNLGAYLDHDLSMEQHVRHLCQSMNFHLRRIGKIRNFIHTGAAKTLVTSLVLSKMDYCNSLLLNVNRDKIVRLQKIQNHAARLVLKRDRKNQASPLLRQLHWLPVNERILYKVLVLCYKLLETGQPRYLSEKLELYVPRRQLRSSLDKNVLVNNSHKSNYTTCGGRSFSRNIPGLWNSLTKDHRNCSSEELFKKKLKTHLFTIAY